MSSQYIRYPSSSGGGGNAAAGQTGLTPPTFADYIGFNNGGVLTGVSAATPLPVTFTTGGPVTVVQPDGSMLHVDIDNFPATTAVTQSTSPWVVSGTVTANAGTGTFAVSAVSLPLPTGAATDAELVTINTTLGSPFQAGGSIGNTSFIVTQTTGSNLHVNIDNFPATQPVSGTVAVSNFPATQPVSGTVAVTQSTSPWVTSVSNFPATQSVTQGTSPWVVSGTVSTTSAANTNGSASNSTSISNTSAISFSPPTNAIGFVIEAESTNTVNLRYAAGTTATNSTGMLLEPGRDSGYIPTAVTVTIIAATAATGQSAGIQWILSS